MNIQEGRERDDMAWQRDQRIVEPLLKLQGLKDIYVHLHNPMYIRGGRIMRMEREKVLEQRVMGSGYDSAGRGKYTKQYRFYDYDFQKGCNAA